MRARFWRWSGAVALLRICRSSGSFELSCMSSLPTRMKGVGLKMRVLDSSQDFSHCRSVGVFPGARGGWLCGMGPVWLGFKFVQDFVVVLLACGGGEDPVGDGGAGVLAALFVCFSGVRGQMALVLVVSGRDLGSFRLSCVSSLPAREVDRIKNEGARVFAGFLPL